MGQEQRTGFFTQSLLVFILKPFCALREVARAPLKRVRTVRSGAFEARVEFGVQARPEGAARPEAQCCHRKILCATTGFAMFDLLLIRATTLTLAAIALNNLHFALTGRSVVSENLMTQGLFN